MTRVHIIGADAPGPTPERFRSAYVADVGDQRILVDCEPATTWNPVKAGMSPAVPVPLRP